MVTLKSLATPVIIIYNNCFLNCGWEPNVYVTNNYLLWRWVEMWGIYVNPYGIRRCSAAFRERPSYMRVVLREGWIYGGQRAAAHKIWGLFSDLRPGALRSTLQTSCLSPLAAKQSRLPRAPRRVSPPKGNFRPCVNPVIIIFNNCFLKCKLHARSFHRHKLFIFQSPKNFRATCRGRGP